MNLQKEAHQIHQWLKWQQSLGIDSMLSPQAVSHFENLSEQKLIIQRLKNKLDNVDNKTASPTLKVVSTPTSMHTAHNTPSIQKHTQPIQSASIMPVTRTTFKNEQLVVVHTPDLNAINSCTTLTELETLLKNDKGCEISKTAQNTVFSVGSLNMGIMLIGEAPGVEEDQEGIPFIGKSGDLLSTIMQTVGIKRDDVYITNVVPWRPPANRPPTPKELTYCTPFLRKHIELAQPKIIILFGGTSAKAVLNLDDGILKLRGHIFQYDVQSSHTISLTSDEQLMNERVKAVKENRKANGILALPTLHPSYIMRSPGQKQNVWRDMLLLKKILSL